MSPGARRLLHAAVLVLCLPLAILAAAMPVNEYVAADDAMVGAVDCDGPMAVLMLAGPAFILYAGNSVGFMWKRARAPRWHLGMALFCLVVSIAVLPNAVRALATDQQNKSDPACR